MFAHPSLRLLCILLGVQLLAGGAAEVAMNLAPPVQETWPAQADGSTGISDWTFEETDDPEKSDDYVRDDEDYEWGDTEARTAKYEALYGYSGDLPDPSVPTYLHYTNFSRYIAWGGGADDRNNYVFQLGVSSQGLDEYLAYLWRFGYDVQSDVTEGGVRRVTLHNPNAPAYLPETYRCDLYLPSEDLITVDPLSNEFTFEDTLAALPALPEEETGKPIPIAGLGTLRLDGIRALHRYAVTDNAQPIDPRAPITLLSNSTQFPIFTRTLANGQVVSVIKADSDTEHNSRFILLTLTLEGSNAALSTADLDFMLGDADSVLSPTAVATSLTQDGSLFVLDTVHPAALTGKQSLTLAFPVDDLLYKKPLRLYVSLAADRLPLWERTSIGFILTK